MNELKQTAADKAKIYDDILVKLGEAENDWGTAAIAVLEAETGIKNDDTAIYKAKPGKVETVFTAADGAFFRFYAKTQNGYSYSHKYQIVRDLNHLRKD